MKKQEGQTKKNLSKTNIILIVLASLALVGAVVGFVLVKTVFSPHRTAANACNQAFDAIYGCDYEDFVETTIYNSECMANLGLSIAGELHNIIEPHFAELKQVMKDSAMNYSRLGTAVEEFSPGEEGFTRCVEMLRGEYFDVYDGKIEKVARAVINFKVSYRDENGKKQTETDTDVSWALRIDGKWYAIPNIVEDAE